MPRDEMGNEIPEGAEGAVTPPAEGGVSAEGGVAVAEAPATAKPAKPAKQTAGIMVSVPIALKEIVDARAQESEMNAGAWVRQLIANTVEYTLPATVRTRAPSEKYMVTLADGSKRAMTKEEKAQAIKDENKKNKDTLKAVLAAARAGKLNLNDLIAQFGATTPAEGASA